MQRNNKENQIRDLNSQAWTIFLTISKTCIGGYSYSYFLHLINIFAIDL